MLVFAVAIFKGGAKPKSDSNASPEQRAAQEIAAPTPVATPDRPAIVTDVKTVLAEYKDNEVRADGKYKGKRIETWGKVGEIKKDVLGKIYATIGTGELLEIPTLQCFAADGQDADFAALSKGQGVTMEATIDGLMMNVLGRECVLSAGMRRCQKIKAALGEGECIVSGNGGIGLGFRGEDAISSACVPLDKYEQAEKQWDRKKSHFVGSKKSSCFVVYNVTLPPEVMTKLSAALDTL